jgi:aryl-alcohol dehydrogenase-like predicted oxidoreductase
MEYRSLGRTGVMVSPLCLGAMNFGSPTTEADSLAIINRALDAGINFVDTANVYNAGESERIVGDALKQNGKREQIVLATKVHGRMGNGPNDGGNSRFHIMKACEDSLRRLQTDHIDLYQLHRPSQTIPQDETLRACDDLVRAGKVRYIGCSTHPAWRVMEALAGGILAGRYPVDAAEYAEGSRAVRAGAMFQARVSRRGREVAAKIGEMAAERGMTGSQLALLWVKDQPGITAPIVGPRTMAHLEDALGVLDKKLADADRPLFDELVHPGNAVADFHNSNEWMKARITD